MIGRAALRSWLPASLGVLSIAVVYAAPAPSSPPAIDAIPLVSACGDDPPGEKIELPVMVAQALNQQPQLLIAQANEQASQSDVQAAKGGFLPQLNLSATEEKFVPRNGDTPVVVVGNTVLGGAQTNSAYASLALQWNIWNNGRDAAALKGAHAGVQSAAYGVDRQRADTLLDVLNAYAELYEAEVIARGDAQAAAGLTAIQARAEKRYAEGYGTEVAVGQARVAALNAVQTLNHDCREFDDKSAALAQAAGIEMGSVRLYALEPPPQPDSHAAARTMDQLVEESPAVEGAWQDVLAAQSALQRAQGEYGPTVGLTAQRDYLGQSPDGFGYANKRLSSADYRVGLQISQPLFPFDSQSADVDKARAQLRKAQASYQEARIEVKTKLLGALSAHREAERSFGAAQSSLADAEQVLALTQAQFDAGRTDLDTVEHARMDRDTAQADLDKLSSQLSLSEWMVERTQSPKEFPVLLLHQLHLELQLPESDEDR